MRLDLSSIINTPGGSLPFSCRLDLSHLEFYGEHPICEPLFVEGVVRNRAGALMLTAHLESELHWICDRCAQPFIQKKAVSLEALLASSLEQEDQMDPDLLYIQKILVREQFRKDGDMPERLVIVNRYDYTENDTLVLKNYRITSM